MKMPILFIAHGSPMNAIATNKYTKTLNLLGEKIPTPKAVLCISAHWQTKGTKIVGVEKPEVIYDFSGFPEELYQVQYPAKGSPEFAEKTQKLIFKSEIVHNWGLDHGAWSVLKHLYSNANIPVFQMSINTSLNEDGHFQVGKNLQKLRESGILILGSGNIVHNLRKIKWNNDDGPFDWCVRFDEKIRDALLNKNRDEILRYKILFNEDAQLSVPTDEHYLPLIYCLGAALPEDQISFPYEGYEMGSLSMRSVMWS